MTGEALSKPLRNETNTSTRKPLILRAVYYLGTLMYFMVKHFTLTFCRHKMERIQNCRQNFDTLLLVGCLGRFHVQEVCEDQFVLLPIELATQRANASDRSL